MNTNARAQYNAFMARLAVAYAVANTTTQFEATVPVAIRLNTAIQDSAEFLNRIGIYPVTDMYGDVLRTVIPNSIAGRVDTKNKKKRREPYLAVNPTENKYTCTKTNFDVGFEYALLDLWARFKDFQKRYMNTFFTRVALDRMLIGFFGDHVAKDTDREKFPELQDVNIGWLKLLETRNPKHFIKEGKIKPGKIIIGRNGDYKNLDQMVYDLWKCIPKAHRTENHIAIIGDRLVTHDTGQTLGSFAQQPTEKAAMAVIERKYGTRVPYVVPMFPDNGLMITNLKNLHIYYQDRSVRRRTKDEVEYDRVADYMSINDAYAIEDYEAIIAVDHKAIVFSEDLPADKKVVQGADLIARIADEVKKGAFKVPESANDKPADAPKNDKPADAPKNDKPADAPKKKLPVKPKSKTDKKA